MNLRLQIFIPVLFIALNAAWALAAPQDKTTAAGTEIEDCLRDKKCRGLVETTFREMFPILLQEVEAALPGRFFNGTVTYAEKHMDTEGHFLKVDCLNAEESSCSKANREILEERILSVGLLMSLPLKESARKQCYHPETWTMTALGEAFITRAQAASPDIKIRIAMLAAKILKKHR